MNNKLSQIFLTISAAAAFMIPGAAFASNADDWSVTCSMASPQSHPLLNAISVSQCRELVQKGDADITFSWTLASDASLSDKAEYTVKFAKGNESCTKSIDFVSSDSCVVVASGSITTTQNTVTYSYPRQNLIPATTPDECENLETSNYMYLIVSDPNNGFENVYTATYELSYRTTRPKAPTGVKATAGGSSIKVEWDNSGAASYKVYYAMQSGDSSTLSEGAYPEDIAGVHTASSESSSITIKSDITEDAVYLIAVTAYDSNGNQSVLSTPVEVTTVASDSFWDSYRAENADVDGGFCFAAYGSTQEPHVRILRQFRDDILMQSAPGRAFVDTYYKLSPPMAYFIGQHPTVRAITRTALWPLYGMAWVLLNMPALFWSLIGLVAFAIAFFGMRKLRRRKLAKTLTPVLAAAIAGGALFASPSDAFADSPVNMMAEFKAGPYAPDNLGNAFSEHFGDKSGFIIEGEYDWQFWRGVGSLGLGFHLAYGNIKGSSLSEDGSGDSFDSTALHWLPLRISLVYRFDYLWTRFEFPFTIYVKAGFDYAFWWVRDGSDSIASDDEGNKGYGGTFGFHVVAGIAFVLDWLAPDMEKAFDVEWGINNSYIFAEYMYNQLDNFGASGAFDLTDKATFQIGIGLEF